MRSRSDIMKFARVCRFSCSSYAVLDVISKNRVFVNTMEGSNAKMNESSCSQDVGLNQSPGSEDVWREESPPPPLPKKKKTSLWKRVKKAKLYLSSGPQGVWLKESLGSQDVVNQSPPPPAPKKKKTSLWKRFKNMFRRTINKKKCCGEVSSTMKAKMNESSCSQDVGLNQSQGSEDVWREESPPPPLPKKKKTSLWKRVKKAKLYLSSGPQGVWLKESLGSQDVVNQSPPPPAPKKKKTSLWNRFKNMFRRTKNKKKRCGEVSSTMKAKMNESSCSQDVGLNQSPGSEDVCRKESPPPPLPKKKKTFLWKRVKCVVPLMTKVHLKKDLLTGSWVNIGRDSDGDDENSEDDSAIKILSRDIKKLPALLPWDKKDFRREFFFKAIDDFTTDLERYRKQHKYLQPNAGMKFTLDEEFEEHAQIGDWEVISKIGKGFGTVYKGKNIHSEMEVVLKKGLYLEESEILFQEAEMMKRFDHKSIVKLIDVHQDELCKRVVLVMEFVPGDTLTHRLDLQKKFSPNEASGIMKQMASAFAYMHSKNVFHRNIKLDSMLCNDLWDVKVVGFGLARIFTQGEKFDDCHGSHDYIAPEIFFENSHEGPPVDVWALGILFTKLLVGPEFSAFDIMKNLHRGLTALAESVRVCKEVPLDITTSDDFTIFNAVLYNPPRCASQLLVSLLARMLHADPMKRPTMEEISNPKWYR